MKGKGVVEALWCRNNAGTIRSAHRQPRTDNHEKVFGIHCTNHTYCSLVGRVREMEGWGEGEGNGGVGTPTGEGSRGGVHVRNEQNKGCKG